MPQHSIAPEHLADHFGPQLLSLIPEWYDAKFGPHLEVIHFSTSHFAFNTLHPLTKHHTSLLHFMNTLAEEIVTGEFDPIVTPAYSSLLQERVATKWLSLRIPTFPLNLWNQLIRYLVSIASRTSENATISLNLIVRTNHRLGTHRIDRAEFQKVIDSIAASPLTFISVAKDLTFLAYEEATLENVSSREATTYPDFLRPFFSALSDGDISAHVTSRGDILLMNHTGLLASRRSGRWKLYDSLSLLRCISSAVGSATVATHLCGVMYDLSFKRHGALLIYDPAHSVLDHITNRECILSGDTSASGVATPHSLLADTLRPIRFGELNGLQGRRKTLTEIASVDGAVVFDDNSILAFGAIIPAVEGCGQVGARTTAANSAKKLGGVPLKVSSDGQSDLYITSPDGTLSDECEAILSLL